MPKSPFQLFLPRCPTTSTVFASPHSGCDYPDSMLARAQLDAVRIRSSEDAFVDRLFDAAPGAGAPFLVARAPRAFVDLNRAPEELDPALIEGVRRGGHNPRIASGLGVVPRVVAGGQAIYRGKISLAEAQARLTNVWHPYHAALRGILDDTRRRFGAVTLIDCHSMPHEAIDAVAPAGQRRPDVVLGDRFGASASGDIVDAVEAAFVAAGLRVARNTPFAGAYIAQTYGRPAQNCHVIQVEIDRALYMDEARIAPRADFAAFKATMDGIVAGLAAIGRRDVPLAAE
ncbi:N-formylglutamate amidohydrolase [Oceaniglobus indicus]|uniref:N-formylglutamate amidohydrolase n=1 Tax=Oceaniglobus indicus TaxID=2047749 RepID=UPI000C1818E9|nr:N-formylglutamate amidohydrolase [Oceaniglobus indicus]